MNPAKPTLTALIIRRHLWAALLTLTILLFALLALTDIVLLRNRRHALAQQLYAVESADDAALLLCDIGSQSGKDHAGSLILDAEGHWTSEPPMHNVKDVPRLPHYTLWDQAPAVLRTGALHGMGHLPWVNETVIWAARKMANPDGEPEIVVAWERVGSIRTATVPIYIAVVIATLLAFGVSSAVALNTVKDVRLVLEDIAGSSSQMAAGDFTVRLSPQPAEELNRVTTAINMLARELNRTTHDLHAEHARLQRLEGLQRQFVADASHELRAPLTSMRVTLEAWQDGVLRPDEEPAALRRLLQETERLGNLVKRLLDLSRIESGRECLEPAPVDLAHVSAVVAGNCTQPHLAAIGIDIPSGLSLVLADEDALYRICYNLIENAQRFTPSTGMVHLWAAMDGDMVRFGVTDTGCGISSAFLPRIWDRFARAPEARAEGKAGSGLGLAMVKALVEAMDGTVGAESIPRHGTTVWVSLPAEKNNR